MRLRAVLLVRGYQVMEIVNRSLHRRRRENHNKFVLALDVNVAESYIERGSHSQKQRYRQVELRSYLDCPFRIRWRNLRRELMRRLGRHVHEYGLVDCALAWEVESARRETSMLFYG